MGIIATLPALRYNAGQLFSFTTEIATVFSANLSDTCLFVGSRALDNFQNPFTQYSVVTKVPTASGNQFSRTFNGSYPSNWTNPIHDGAVSIGRYKGLYGGSASQDWVTYPDEDKIVEVLSNCILYVFATQNEAIEYLEVTTSEAQDIYARAHALNYDLLNPESLDFSTEFKLGYDTPYMPAFTLGWSCPLLNTGEFDPNGFSVNIIIKLSFGGSSTLVKVVENSVEYSERKTTLEFKNLISQFINTTTDPVTYPRINISAKLVRKQLPTENINDLTSWPYCELAPLDVLFKEHIYPADNVTIGYNESTISDSTTMEFVGDSSNVDFPDDPIPEEPVDPDDPRPPISAGSGVMTTTYILTASRLQSFAYWLWNTSVFNDIKLLNNSPVENIVSCKYVPEFDDSWIGGRSNIVLGNVTSPIDTATLGRAIDQTIEVGTIEVPKKFNNFLDYEQTNITIYLPFIGYKELDAYMVMGHTIKVIYAIDVVVGTCMAMIKVQANNGNWIQAYTFDGVNGLDIPITANNRTQLEASTISSITQSVMSAPTNPVGAVGNLINIPLSAKFHTFTNGHASSQTAYYASKSAFLIIQRPVAEIPTGYAHAVGRPCNKTLRVGSLSGFTKLIDPDLSGIHADQDELESLKSILTSGFYA